MQENLIEHNRSGGRYAVVETAGGVLSPAPSSTLQAEVYRKLRLPTILVGDSNLGGIGATISAFESLHVRGFDVDSVILFQDQEWGNHHYLKGYFDKYAIHVQTIRKPPPLREFIKAQNDAVMMEYYEKESINKYMTIVIDRLHYKHFHRTSKLASLPSKAEAIIWHPFRQHALPQNLVAIDSAYHDYFQVYNQETDTGFAQVSSQVGASMTTPSQSPAQQMLTPLFDASASWWTQGLGHGNPRLALTAAHAAGRYGHVMFANAVHEPALDLCYNLLETLKNPRLARVFFTDNGSTGMEVAVKMALRASCQRYGWNKDDNEQPVGIIGLKGSYHGDTIGVMNCSEPNTFNEKVDWYKPWGYWFDPPQVMMRNGTWQVEVPASMAQHGDSSTSMLTFDHISSIFDFSARTSDADFYKAYITRTLQNLTHKQKRRFGALIVEPILMGAGGMIFVDPLFQRTLITTIREDSTLINPSYTPPKQDNRPTYIDLSGPDESTDWSGVPFIADEVFTGLYRLGRPSSSSFLSMPTTAARPVSGLIPTDLNIAPDISVHAKLLTGGLLPLAVTTASTSIFNTFLSPSKADALLHGHSYTAHPIGCAVANKSLTEMKGWYANSTSWRKHRAPWDPAAQASTSPSDDASADATDASSGSSTVTTAEATNTSSTESNPSQNQLFSFFHPSFLTTLSKHPLIHSCFALGTVLSLTMKPPPSSTAAQGTPGGGYNSTATATLQSRLLATLQPGNSGVHARVLGDVLYIMTSITTSTGVVRLLEEKLMVALDEEAKGWEKDRGRQ